MVYKLCFNYFKVLTLLYAGSATKSGNGAEGRNHQREMNLNANEQREIPRFSAMHISKTAPNRENETLDPNMYPEPTICFNILSIFVAFIMTSANLHSVSLSSLSVCL